MGVALHALLGRLERGDPLEIAGLGDSLTCGWMVRRGFFDRFVDALAAAHPRAVLARINAGVPGATVRDGLARADALAGQRPDLVVVQFGLNDCFSQVAVPEFARLLHLLGKLLAERGVQVVLATSCPVRDPEFQRVLDPFYSSIARVGETLAVPVARLHEHWGSVAPTWPDPDALYLADGVHPNDHGHQILAEGLLRLFEIAARAGT